jgi:hypothetical protein
MLVLIIAEGEVMLVLIIAEGEGLCGGYGAGAGLSFFALFSFI